MNAIIVDDELAARTVLRHLLTEYADDINIVGEADNYEQAIDLLQSSRPDIIFMDIDLGAHTGFDILDTLDDKNTGVALVFTTSFNEFAIRAFKYAAIDYLLKPIIPEELRNTVNRIKGRSAQGHKEYFTRLKQQLSEAFAQTKVRKYILIKGYEGTSLVPVDDILYLKGEGSYTKIVKKDNSSSIASRSLHHFQEQLAEHPSFVRVHKSYIANINEVKFISKKEISEIYFNNGATIPVTHYDEIWKLLNH